jgi:F0F1-type ATP synthase alpha subunit
MQLNASEISDLIKKQIEGFDFSVEARTEGTVISVSDGIVRIHGLADAQFGEMLEFPGNTFGMALNLEQDSVGSVVLGDYLHISEGDTVKCTNRIMEVPVGPELLGRVVSPLGKAIDGKGDINERMVKSVYKACGWDLIDERYLQVMGLLAAMPLSLPNGLSADLKRMKRFKTMLTTM